MASRERRRHRRETLPRAMSQPRYVGLKRALHRAEAPLDAPECHGLLCALLSAGGEVPLHAWLDEFLPGGEAQESAAPDQLTAPLRDVYDATRAQFAEQSVALELLLPDDSAPLPERTLALAGWCQGYLYGLDVCGIGARTPLPEASRELLGDFAELAEAATGSGEPDELEAAYAELVEFVRVGALLIHAELRPQRAAPELH